jgi:type IV pilus assembly protein PilE
MSHPSRVPPDSPRGARGFTLVELMIAVAIAGIIAAVAYPSFMGQVRKSRRADAVSALSQVMQAQERFRANNATYGSRFVLSSASLTNVSALAADATQWDLTGGRYRLTFSGSPTATGYTVQAAAQGGQTADTVCATMSIAVANGGNATYTPAACFSR